MSRATLNNVELQEVEKVREYYVIKKALFGIISWKVVVRREAFGKSLRILNDGEPIEELSINGKEWVLKK